jgi:PKHD-type hydroxylase
MGRHTVFRYWTAALAEPLCDLIIEEGARSELLKATLSSPKSRGEKSFVNENVRKTDVVMWDSTHWTCGITSHFINLANREVWRYRLTLSQGVQFGSYSDGGTYDWHKDEFDQPFGNEGPPEWRNQSRKLSAVVNLSASSDYEGGDLMLKDTYGNEVNDPKLNEKMRAKGTIIVFPAYTPHKVMPVHSGTRYSLVTWMLGPPFS